MSLPLTFRSLPPPLRRFSVVVILAVLAATGCSRVEIVESPRTGYAPETTETKEPELVWSTRGLTRGFDYLGTVSSRAWTYDGALEQLMGAGKQLRADALVDVHYERVGFMKTMHAFAVKYR